MRILLYIVIIVLTLFAPVDKLDVAKLEPIEAVAISKEQGMVVLQTDTEATGRGMTAEEALSNMKENTAAVIYLDTAEYLLVAPDAQEEAKLLIPYLKDSVKVAQYTGGNVRQEAKYLDTHDESARPEN